MDKLSSTDILIVVLGSAVALALCVLAGCCCSAAIEVRCHHVTLSHSFIHSFILPLLCAGTYIAFVAPTSLVAEKGAGAAIKRIYEVETGRFDLEAFSAAHVDRSGHYFPPSLCVCA